MSSGSLSFCICKVGSLAPNTRGAVSVRPGAVSVTVGRAVPVPGSLGAFREGWFPSQEAGGAGGSELGIPRSLLSAWKGGGRGAPAANTDGGRQGGQAGTEETFLVLHSAPSPEMNVARALGWVLGIHIPAPGSSQAGEGVKMPPQMNPVPGADTETPRGLGKVGLWLGLAGFEDMEACQGG